MEIRKKNITQRTSHGRRTDIKMHQDRTQWQFIVIAAMHQCRILKARTPCIQCWIEGSHSSGYDRFIFWHVTPRSMIKVNRSFAGIDRLHF
jgi:hypothetical protein